MYSASHSASNALVVPQCCEEMSFPSRSEAIGAPSRVPESLEVSSIPSDPQRR